MVCLLRVWHCHPNPSWITSQSIAFPLLSTHTHHRPSDGQATRRGPTQLLAIFAPKIGPTSILVHCLGSGVETLRICHPLCIDTQLTHHHSCGRLLKPGFTKKWCDREIQTHALALICFGSKTKMGPNFGEFKIDHESISERMTRGCGRGGQGAVRAAVADSRRDARGPSDRGVLESSRLHKPCWTRNSSPSTRPFRLAPPW